MNVSSTPLSLRAQIPGRYTAWADISLQGQVLIRRGTPDGRGGSRRGVTGDV